MVGLTILMASSKMFDNFFWVFNFNRFIYNSRLVLPIHDWVGPQHYYRGKEGLLKAGEREVLCTSVPWRTLSPPPRTFRGRNILSGAAARQIFCTQPKIVARPPDFEKNYWTCIFEGYLSTNPILSALHFQGLKSNIYVHFHWVNM